MIAIEAKAGDARRQISRSARSFIDAHAPQQLLVDHGGKAGEILFRETRVRFLRMQDLGARPGAAENPVGGRATAGRAGGPVHCRLR